jgi:hypothetical protein
MGIGSKKNLLCYWQWVVLVPTLPQFRFIHAVSDERQMMNIHLESWWRSGPAWPENRGFGLAWLSTAMAFELLKSAGLARAINDGWLWLSFGTSPNPQGEISLYIEYREVVSPTV